MEDFKEVNKALKVKLWEEWYTCMIEAVLFKIQRSHIPYFLCSCQGHAWLKDDEATQCKQCQKEFSIARRKVGSFIAVSYYLSNIFRHFQ